MNEFGLTVTQRSVIKRICSLGNNKLIAHDMGLSEATIKVHVRTVLKKLKIKDRTLLAVWAVRNGLDQ